MAHILHFPRSASLPDWEDIVMVIVVLITAFIVTHSPAPRIAPKENLVHPTEIVTLRIAPDAPLTPPNTGWAIRTAGLGDVTFSQFGLNFSLPMEGNADAEVRISALGDGLLRDIKILTYTVSHLASPLGKGLTVRINVGDDILTFEPQRQSTRIMLGISQEWNCSIGLWNSMRDGPITLAQYVEKYPNAKLREPIRIQAGFDGERWGTFEALLSEVEVTTIQHVARFKFEL